MKDRFSQMTTSIWQKTALVFLGLVLSLVLLEVGMRLGGFILSSIQAYENFQSIKQKGTYRILCLGESPTEGQYPHLLEQILNQRNIGVHFSVIDKGKSGTNTSAIVSRVESFLTEYHPDMVIAMMGTNDHGSHMPLKALTTSEGTPFIQSLRTYDLARLLWLHILTKLKEIGSYKSETNGQSSEKPQTFLPRTGPNETSTESIPAGESFRKTILAKSKETEFHISAGDKRSSVKAEIPLPGTGLKETSAEPIVAHGSSKKSGGLDHENDNARVELGRLRKEQGKFSEAEDLFKEALSLNPENDEAYAELGKLYEADHKFSEAEDSFQKAIRLNPQDGSSFFALGLLYRKHNKPLQAEDIFNKAIELYPIKAYFELGWLFLDQGRFAEGEDSFKKVMARNPENRDEAWDAYFGLGALYRQQGKFSRAEDSFRRAVEINPKNERVLGALASLYEQMDKTELAKECADKVNELRSKSYDPTTVSNYRKLKGILDKKGIKLVCVQYPMRNAEPLKRIFEKDKGVIFVDNENAFKEAVRKGSYKEYFRDMFAGDFGHCIQKGNELLAQNIADVILREVFNK